MLEGIAAAKRLEEAVFSWADKAHGDIESGPREQYALARAFQPQLAFRLLLLTELPDGEDGVTRTQGAGGGLMVEMQRGLQFRRHGGQRFEIHGQVRRRESGLKAPPFQGCHVTEIRY